MQGVLAAAYQYGYRLSLLISMAGALYLADYGSWPMTYTAMAGCMVIGILTTLWCREPEDRAPEATDRRASYAEKVAAWFKHAVADRRQPTELSALADWLDGVIGLQGELERVESKADSMALIQELRSTTVPVYRPSAVPHNP